MALATRGNMPSTIVINECPIVLVEGAHSANAKISHTHCM